jgi:uncharacterized protein (DUF1015 family)
MSEIRPFRGIRYNPKRVEDFDQVISPPYDVIDAGLQEELYRKSPYNIVRLDFGRVLPGDGEAENRYTRAARLLQEWLEGGVLIQDRDPALYYIEEEYRVAEETRTRKGFLATVRIEGPESHLYRPHEKTLAGPKTDRLDLTRACRANLSPIFSLYDEPSGATQEVLEAEARAEAPLIAVRMQDGPVTRLWRVTNPRVLGDVAERMRGKSFFIADGHHRYETALTYRDAQRQENPWFTGEEPWNYVMMYFANLWSPGLTILPTHRAVVNLEGFELSAFLEKAEEHFLLTEVPCELSALKASLAVRGARKHRFGLVSSGAERCWTLELREEGLMDRLAAHLPEVLRTLDVTILHALLLEGALGIDAQAQEAQRNLRYVKGERELLRVVRDGEAQLGFLLNATRIEEVKSVAEKDEKMPQKSTFFYPKLVTGLVLNPLTEKP